MGRKLVTCDTTDVEKAAMLACSSLVARLMPAADPADFEHPAIREALEFHAAAEAEQRRLLNRGLPWSAVRTELSAWTESRPTPVADMLRVQRPGPRETEARSDYGQATAPCDWAGNLVR